MSITVAIPNFNGLEYLKELIPRLQAIGTTDIVVLDDASTDGSVGWLKAHDIKTIAGEQNLGPTGNRNRILGTDTGDIIVFIDADMQIISDDLLTTLEQLFKVNHKLAVAAPLILGATDEPMWYNWGYDASPKQDGLTEALNGVALAHWSDPAVMDTVRKLAKGRVGHFEEPIARTVDWVSEAVFAVSAETFRELGGFDPKFRMYHEGPDFCLRARQAGYEVRFEPSLRVKHLDMHTGDDKQRAQAMRESTKYWYEKHYGVPDEVTRRFFLQ